MKVRKMLKFFPVVFFSFALAFGCKKDEEDEKTTPQIISVTTTDPSSGKVGSEVEIIGTNFTSPASDYIVEFNNVAAKVKSLTETIIVTEVPEKATTGKVTVSIKGVIVEGPVFTVIQAPEISSISPDNGKIGSLVTISGKNFTTKASDYTIKFNGQVAVIDNITGTEIKVRVPENASTGPVTLTETDESVVTGPTFTVQQFDYGTFTDPRNGRVYKTIQIGNQTWMAENLNYDVPNDDDGDVCYDNNSDICTAQGRLYTYESAIKATPSGWHIPSNEEWRELEKSLGMPQKVAEEIFVWRGTDEGIKIGPNGSSGLNLSYGGTMVFDKVLEKMKFLYFADYGYYWTSSMEPINGGENIYRSITRLTDKNYNTMIHNGTVKLTNPVLFSVRCIKD